MKKLLFCLLLAASFVVSNYTAIAAEPSASPEVTAALQPYLDSHKMAGIIGIIANKTGRCITRT